MLVSLKEALKGTKNGNYAIAGFNVFGYEDAIMVTNAAEELNVPVVLMTNKDAVEHMPISILGKILNEIAVKSTTQVCVHLDHAKTKEQVIEAMENGYSSVMYDGSQQPLEENIKNTKEIVELAHKKNITVEGEIGSVGYSDPALNAKAIFTEPSEAKKFVEETGLDAVAVAIGTLHRMEEQTADIQYDRLAEIEKVVDIPIVIHGSTGVKDEDLEKFANSGVGKVNIGTALRMAFGKKMRDEVISNEDEFDRLKLFKEPMEEVKKIAKEKMIILGAKNIN